MTTSSRRAGAPQSSPSVALLVDGYPGQRSVEEYTRLAEEGEEPRNYYVEVARALGAEMLDGLQLSASGSPAARAVARVAGTPAGQVTEAFLRRRRYATICAWSDRLGVPMALLSKLARSREDLVLEITWLSRPKKAMLVKHLRLGTHLRAVITNSTYQLEFATRELRIPPDKLHFVPRPVDDSFWSPAPQADGRLICAAGWEARDYPTLLEAVKGLDVEVTLAVGMIGMVPDHQPAGAPGPTSPEDPRRLDLFAPWKGTYGFSLQEEWLERIRREELPANVTVVYQLEPKELRELYARSRFVVVPLHDVDTNCGITTITEAMAMGRAVVVSRTRAQRDAITHEREGLYVPPRDPAALRSAIERLLENSSEAERMGRAGRALVEAQHTMDAYLRRVRAVVEARPDESSGARSRHLRTSRPA